MIDKRRPLHGYDAGCEAFDFNADGAIDLLDFAAFATALNDP